MCAYNNYYNVDARPRFVGICKKSLHYSNHKLDKAVVLTDVTLKNVLTWAQDSFETGSVELDTL